MQPGRCCGLHESAFSSRSGGCRITTGFVERPDVYIVDLDAYGERDLSDVWPSGEIDVCSSLWELSTEIRDKCVEDSVQAPTTAGGVFKLPRRGLNTLSEHRKLLAGMDWLHGTIWSSEAQIQLLSLKFHRILRS